MESARRLTMADAQDRTHEIKAAQVEGEYEEITSDEVDRVISGLEALINQTGSENIRAYLEEAADHIFDLVYGDDADVVCDPVSDIQSEAA
jgi:hypothetical protein